MDWTRLPLARAAVDRAAHRRLDPDVLERAWEEATTRVLVTVGPTVPVRTAEDGTTALVLVGPRDLEAFGPPAADGVDDAVLLFLGEVHGPEGIEHTVTYVALALPEGSESSVGAEVLGDPVSWSTLRDVGHLLGDGDAGLAATAAGLAAWHARHRRCPRCGSVTVPVDGGWLRRCSTDGSDHYPRTDPAVIMAVVDPEDRLLLGHAVHWPERRFSTLAGFVETGESLEGAVRREVLEEAGVTVSDVVYKGSQPWPFPASLMLAFVARATSTEVQVDGVELTEARWFSRQDLADAVAGGEILLPMRTSVALALIEDWFGGPIRASWA